MAHSPPSTPPTPQFPPHNTPRTWLLTTALSPLSLLLMPELLNHGDYVAALVPEPSAPSHHGQDDGEDRLRDELQRMTMEMGHEMGRRFWAVGCGGSRNSTAQREAAIATVVKGWGRVDVLLCCSSEALVGTVQELSTPSTRPLISDQFDSNLFGPVEMIKAVLPTMRAQKRGHVIVVTGITGHIGTPGLGMYCAAQWGLEGFCDSLAYEVAPFNIKVTIVQPNMEVNILTNRITFAPAMPEYTSAPSHTLLEETIHALLAIGGHPNPPSRHIVGHDAVASVKEKLQSTTEEMEEFEEVATGVDFKR
ncbi:MAG: hypothetical protein M1817_006644 [Caeruleum heppii]|nr:MAG: hypothetical protein M1817_006644 [Caeruleum heppii]